VQAGREPSAAYLPPGVSGLPPHPGSFDRMVDPNKMIEPYVAAKG